MFKTIMTPIDLCHLGDLERALQISGDLRKLYDVQVQYTGFTSPSPTSWACCAGA